MYKSHYEYHDINQRCQGYVAYDEAGQFPRPAVMIAHDWSGCNAFAKAKAEKLAELGYVGFALDMYGDGRTGETTEEKMALMTPLVSDRTFLLSRISAGLKALQAMNQVDNHKIAVIGFCFGGLCALDLARSGADIKGTVSFHGLLNRDETKPVKKIIGKILALHGYDDPMVSPDQVNQFCKEMTEAQADWQVHMYGHTQHAFTNPQAHDQQLGTIYNEIAEKRSWQAMCNFLNEVFA